MLDTIEMGSEHTMGRRMSRESLVARPIHERRLTRQASRGEILGAPTPCSGSRRSSLTPGSGGTGSRRSSLTRGLGETNGFSITHVTVRERILTRQASKEILPTMVAVVEDKTAMLRRERGFSRTFSQELTALGTQLTRQRLLSRTFSSEDLDETLPILLRSLRELIKDDKEILRKDDEFLSKFLRVKKYNVERAHAQIRTYYSNVRRNLDILLDIRPNSLIPVFNQNLGVPLKCKAPDGSTVVFFRLGHWNTKQFTLQEVVQSFMFMAEQVIRDREVQVNGGTIIADLKGIGLCHVRQVQPSDAKRIVYGVQDGFPIKQNGLHILNMPFVFYSIFYVIQRLLKEKLRQRIHMHSNLASLHAHFDVSMLPTCLGGPLELEDAVDHRYLNSLLKEDRLYSEFYK